MGNPMQVLSMWIRSLATFKEAKFLGWAKSEATHLGGNCTKTASFESLEKRMGNSPMLRRLRIRASCLFGVNNGLEEVSSPHDHVVSRTRGVADEVSAVRTARRAERKAAWHYSKQGL